MHDFTVFITSYNYGHYIGNAIDSVITQTSPNWNLYILDNGSTDNTFEVIAPYLADPRIRLIKRPTNIGHTMNIALGYIELDGRFISTLQADDWLEPTFIEKALKAFSEHPDIALVAYGWLAYVEQSGSYFYPTSIPYPRSFEGITALSPHLTLGNFIPLHMVAFRKSEIAAIFQEMIKTPLRQLGEQFIIKRLEDRNGPSYFFAEATGYWRRHDQQLTNFNSLNHITSIESVVEPLIYNQTKDIYLSHTRFLSLVYFVSRSANIPYRSATEWLLSENGQYLAEQYGIAVSDNTTLYHCLACALMMAHSALATAELIDNDAIQAWITHLSNELNIDQKRILSIANGAYNGYLFPDDIENLISESLGKSAVQCQTSLKGSLPSTSYPQWLRQRELHPEDGQIIANSLKAIQAHQPKFHLLLRLKPGSEAHLADTLDSLNQAYYENWRLDIVTTLTIPDGMDDIPCIGWHTLADDSGIKDLADHLVANHSHDWIIELPVGARLDPLYLWRLAMHSQAFSESRAFFVDDDCCSASSTRHSPRFKPGVNPAALLSADLAGPLCVRHDTWQATGGACHRNGSPWFYQLLRIADRFGWETIKHIPDVLISYPDSFPSNTESCMYALVEDWQEKGIDSKIVHATVKSWCIRYPLKQSPSISIIILSIGQRDLLSRCFASILENTDYPNFEIIIALSNAQGAPDLESWLAKAERSNKMKVRVVRTNIGGNHATRCNTAAMASSSDFLLFLKEEAVVIQGKWLEELVRTGAQSGIGGVSPRIIQPGSTMIESAGNVLGLNGIVGSPYQGKIKLGEETGYLDCIYTARDVSTLPAACMLIRKESYVSAGGMDETDLGNHLAETDLSLKIRKNGERLLYQPLSNIVCSDPKEEVFDTDPGQVATQVLFETRAKQAFFARWYPEAAVDPFWNPALSLKTNIPTPELEFQARWRTTPSDLPRILAHALPNGQGDHRVTLPLNALSKAGMVSECIWRQRTKGDPRFNSIGEIIRMNPDSIIVQSYILTPALAALQEWEASGCRPFTVYAQDDLITEMDVSNPFRKGTPANARARLQYALKRCDRLVVSTDFLAEAYRNFVLDIRVVPNRLKQEAWLPLRGLRRTEKKPRIGWAGGNTHQGDLLLLKEIIEQTRNEADWIFFGMCPDEIRPLVAEYHGLVKFHEYPAYLASLNLDMAVAPLTQTPFNQGKSNLRLLEYGILGIPVVCTDIDPYQNSPACRVNNTVAEWTNAILARIHDPEAREREGDAMRRWVLKDYLLENHLEEWLEAHLPT